MCASRVRCRRQPPPLPGSCRTRTRVVPRSLGPRGRRSSSRSISSRPLGDQVCQRSGSPCPPHSPFAWGTSRKSRPQATRQQSPRPSRQWAPREVEEEAPELGAVVRRTRGCSDAAFFFPRAWQAAAGRCSRRRSSRGSPCTGRSSRRRLRWAGRDLSRRARDDGGGGGWWWRRLASFAPLAGLTASHRPHHSHRLRRRACSRAKVRACVRMCEPLARTHTCARTLAWVCACLALALVFACASVRVRVSQSPGYVVAF